MWLKITEIYCLTLLRLEVQSQDVARAIPPLKPFGEPVLASSQLLGTVGSL